MLHHVLIIGSVWPEPQSTAAGGRMMQLIEQFQLQGWKITFACAAADSDFMFDVSTIGISKISIELNSSSFDEFIIDLQPTIVLFDRFNIEEQYGWRVAEHCPAALRILDTEDLHCLRRGRQQAFKENREFVSTNLLKSEVAKREIASILRCDISLVISGFEMQLLTEIFKIDKSILYYLPFLFDAVTNIERQTWLSFEEKKHFICIGNFLHEPNWNAVQYLKEDIWPLIKAQLPEAELHIYGAYPSQKVLELHTPKQGFIIMGRAENAKEVVSKARICLAPLRFGAGIKGKLAEAMQCGTPSITTGIGAEAMHGELPWNGTIANTPQEIAEAAIELYTNQQKWEIAQKNGIDIINSIYSKAILGKGFTEHILSVQQNLEHHRINNFMGSLLLHHSAASTKYMSKWIEEKNR